jgi:hypothetical protein
MRQDGCCRRDVGAASMSGRWMVSELPQCLAAARWSCDAAPRRWFAVTARGLEALREGVGFLRSVAGESREQNGIRSWEGAGCGRTGRLSKLLGVHANAAGPGCARDAAAALAKHTPTTLSNPRVWSHGRQCARGARLWPSS